MQKEFENWWKNYRDSKEINSYPSMEEITQWWVDKLEGRENKIYKFLRSKVVVLSGDMPVVHADYLEKIKNI